MSFNYRWWMFFSICLIEFFCKQEKALKCYELLIQLDFIIVFHFGFISLQTNKLIIIINININIIIQLQNLIQVKQSIIWTAVRNTVNNPIGSIYFGHGSNLQNSHFYCCLGVFGPTASSFCIFLIGPIYSISSSSEKESSSAKIYSHTK